MAAFPTYRRGMGMVAALASAAPQIREERARQGDAVKEILRAHDPNLDRLDDVAEAVTKIARYVFREPEDVANELVETLKNPPVVAEGFSSRIRFSLARKTYEWDVFKQTRQQMRYEARRRAKAR